MVEDIDQAVIHRAGRGEGLLAYGHRALGQTAADEDLTVCELRLLELEVTANRVVLDELALEVRVVCCCIDTALGAVAVRAGYIQLAVLVVQTERLVIYQLVIVDHGAYIIQVHIGVVCRFVLQDHGVAVAAERPLGVPCLTRSDRVFPCRQQCVALQTGDIYEAVLVLRSAAPGECLFARYFLTVYLDRVVVGERHVVRRYQCAVGVVEVEETHVHTFAGAELVGEYHAAVGRQRQRRVGEVIVARRVGFCPQHVTLCVEFGEEGVTHVRVLLLAGLAAPFSGRSTLVGLAFEDQTGLFCARRLIHVQQVETAVRGILEAVDLGAAFAGIRLLIYERLDRIQFSALRHHCQP